MQIPFTRSVFNAKHLKKANSTDAAYDLYALDSANILPGQRAMISTGISMAIPQGYYGHICPRSGLALKQGIDVLGGIIDSGFRGVVQVILINHSHIPDDLFEVKAGDRIAQIIIKKCEEVEWLEVKELPPADRGDAGFGSSGSK